MKEDGKQRFILMLAIGMTALLVMKFFAQTPEQSSAPPAAPAAQTAQAAPARQQRTESADPAVAPAADVEFDAGEEYTVRVRVGEEGKNAHGYEASFSSTGAGLIDYRLLGYFRVPQNDTPENRIVLLDRMAPGRESLMIEEITTGIAVEGRQNLTRSAIRNLRYELVEAPAGAVIEPKPAESVKLGDKLVFRAVFSNWEIVKTFRFPSADVPAPDFTIAMDLSWRNLAETNRLLSYNLVGPAGMIADDESPQFGPISILTASQASSQANSVDIERKTLLELHKIKREGNKPAMSEPDNRANLAWIGAKNRFFAALMTADAQHLKESNGAGRLLYAGDPLYLPTAKDLVENLKSQPEMTTEKGRVPAFEETSFTVEPGTVAAGATFQTSYMLYAGPAIDSYMETADPRLQGVVSYTWKALDFVSRLLVRLLTFFDGVLGNYGLAIIAVTIIIKIILHPLNRKTFVSMNKMSKLAPLMKDIQKKYANDRARMQQEMSKFYKENGVSMAGGCLPMFLQLPIFLALYGAFSQGFSMRHAAFIPGWIQDLSKPDSVYDLGFALPWLGWSQISILPIIYFALQFLQMSMQPKPTDPQQAQQQKIMKFMPLMFVFIFYTMPAGLVLYFTISALAGVAENWWMRHYLLPRMGLGDTPAAAATAATQTQAGTGAAVVPSDANKKKKKKK